MNPHRIARALAALVAAGALVSCTADAEPQASGDRDHKGKAAAKEERDDRKPGQERRGEQRAKDKHGPAKRQGVGGSSAGSGGVKATTGSAPGGDTTKNPTRQTAEPACLDDASGDTDRGGSTPAYVDLTGGCLRPQRDQLALEATAAGAIPGAMPDEDTEASYGFQLEPVNGSEIYVYAQGSPSGWTAYVSRDGNQRQIAAPVVTGHRMTMTIPAAELGRGTVQWLVESSFLKPELLTTNYAFDTAPNAGTARFR